MRHLPFLSLLSLSVAFSLAACRSSVEDADGDGWIAGQDCDDHDSDLTGPLPWAADLDGDTFGDPESTVDACFQPEGYVPNNKDCDDTTALANPDMRELCGDGIDNDCDGLAEDTSTCDVELASSYSFNGANLDDYAGYGICAPGDLNGDGAPDLLIGAINSALGGVGGGAVFALYGPFTESRSLATAEGSLLGQESDHIGQALLGPGDLDEDGYNDFIVGIDRSDAAGTDMGQVVVLRGPLGLQTRPSDAWLTFTGTGSRARAGYALAMVGDQNSDGIQDLLIGAPQMGDSVVPTSGGAHLVLGPYTESLDLSLAPATLLGLQEGELAGASLSGGGDFNGDGAPDLVVGSSQRIYVGKDQGAASLFLGPVSADMSLAQADMLVQGESAGSRAGSALGLNADLSGDGLDDLLVGAPQTTGVGNLALFLGGSPSADPLTLGQADSLFYSKEGGRLGTSFDTLDFNGDGELDLAVGAPGESRVFLFLGPIGAGSIDAESADVGIIGERTPDLVGWVVQSAGDMNADSLQDLLIGAPKQEADGTNGGAGYLVLGLVW